MTKMLNTLKYFAVSALFLCSFSSAADSSAVEVRFSDYLNERMVRISNIDKRQIKREWESVNLAVADLENYSIPSLMTEMMIRGIEDAHPEGFDGRIVLLVDNLYVRGFPLAALESFSTRMNGSVQYYDQDGNLKVEHKVQTVLLPRHARNESRVGPIAREFVAEALEKVFPDYKVSKFAFL